jgi:hypothetical protein
MKPLYGITHNIDGSSRAQDPRIVKVGIGLPKGKAIHVYIDSSDKWAVIVGAKKDNIVISRFNTKNEAHKFYQEAKMKAPEREAPQKLPYFTFSRVSPDGSFEPEWDVIMEHGPIPTEIDIVFVKDEPLDASYEMWTKTELKCKGDGMDAMRINSMAVRDQEKVAAASAIASGQKFFPMKRACREYGCPHAKSVDGKASACKPHGRLLFQLLCSPRLGSTAYFDTTGFRSISQLYSCIETFKGVTGRGESSGGFVAGIPLTMVLRPYRTAHNGQSATQFGVSLEFRADSAVELKRQLINKATEFRLERGTPVEELNPAPIDITTEEEDEEIPPATAAAMNAEFDGGPLGNEEDFNEPGAATPVTMPKRKSEKEESNA